MNATPLSLLLRAFGVSGFQIVGHPTGSQGRYDVVATVPDGRVLNDQDRRVFFEKMLAERWQLRYRPEKTRNLRVYSLVNDGSKMVQHTGPGEYGMKVERAGPRVTWSTRGNMQRLIEILGGFVGNVVSNDTALGGEYDFTLEWVQDPNATDAGPSLFTALREQLGLRLVSADKPAPVIVIDHIERPSENGRY